MRNNTHRMARKTFLFFCAQHRTVSSRMILESLKSSLAFVASARNKIRLAFFETSDPLEVDKMLSENSKGA